MAKPKRRVTRTALTLSDELNEPLKKLAKLVRKPKTVIITELLTDVLPMVQQAIEAIDQVKAGRKEAVIETMAEFIAKASLDYDQAKLDFDLAKEKLKNG